LVGGAPPTPPQTPTPQIPNPQSPEKQIQFT